MMPMMCMGGYYSQVQISNEEHMLGLSSRNLREWHSISEIAEPVAEMAVVGLTGCHKSRTRDSVSAAKRADREMWVVVNTRRMCGQKDMLACQEPRDSRCICICM